jgi:N-acetylmuramoyl-L-alanine amidase
MNQFGQFGIGIGVGLVSVMAASVAHAQTSLSVVYPPNDHTTTADRIFLIGTAPSDGNVTVNGETIERSPAGHFAPSIPLDLGSNTVTLRHGDNTLTLTINRVSAVPTVDGVGFAENSLTPAVDWVRQPGELLCLEAIAPESSTVSVTLADQTLPLQPMPQLVALPSNLAVLTAQNDPIPYVAIPYRGCAIAPDQPSDLGSPQYTLSLNGETLTQSAPGQIVIQESTTFEIAEVVVASGTARTGPSTNYSRLTPLPTGTQATITGRDGDWLRLDYGAWIRESDVTVRSSAMPVRSQIRSLQAQDRGDRTEVIFPLEMPVPVSVQQTADTLTLSLHNATAQTDTIWLDDDPVIERLDWSQPQPGRIDYRFTLKTDQQWGYTLEYRDTNSVLSLRHPPTRTGDRPLEGISILLDPGHGSDADLGARGPTGYPEKDVTLLVSQLLRDELEDRGATVIMTREGDEDLWPHDRVEVIEATEPAIALSIHYNALPDNGDAVNTAGIGTFWYHAQAHNLSVFLHNYLVDTLDRPSYGVFWNNLALTRPSVTPSVLLELGFMINPYEFEWIMDTDEQHRLATALADGITLWFHQHSP